MARYLYNYLMLALLITGFPVLLPFLVTSRKRRKTVLQRFFFCFHRETLRAWRREAGQGTIWVHALSLGEVTSAVPLVMELEARFGKEKLVFSASTLTGFETAGRHLGRYVRRVFFFPYDILFSVARAVRLVAPELVLIVETDLWPNFMDRLQSKGIPAMLVNARLSDRSAAGYRRVRGIIQPLINTFDIVCVQSREDARRFAALGARPDRVFVTGNLKFDQAAPALSERKVAKWRRAAGLQAGDRVIVAGSTHPGEEEILLEGVGRLKERQPELKLIIAPRDPLRARTVKKLSTTYGLRAVCLAEMEKQPASAAIDVVVIDRIGILGEVYRLGDIAFVGGSLVPAGGHNPLEPAAHGKPVLFGPDMSDFRLIARWLVDGQGAVRVDDRDSFVGQARRLLTDEALARATGRKARRIFTDNCGAVHRTLTRVGQAAGWPDA